MKSPKNTKQLIEGIKNIEHGFKHIIEAGDSILSEDEVNHFDISAELIKNESYQVRMLATYLLGQLSTNNPKALKILETTIAADENWRVQEMLARSFDHYCKTLGYEHSLPTIEKWLTGNSANVKRAVVEGLRIWTSKPYFKTNPKEAIKLISRHRADDSEYLRRSVGNALRDIGKKHPDLIATEISAWDLTDSKVKFTHTLVRAR